MGRTPRSIFPLLLASLILTACGGGGDDNGSVTTSANAAASVAPQDAGVPAATGNTATDGFNWFNFRRRQLGLQAVSRNALIDAAALGHSVYQRDNDIITHEQTAGRPSFTGRTAGDRLRLARYPIPANDFAYGEVISATTDTSGFNAAEDLIAAIYHRFVIFEPLFKEAGAGAAGRQGGLTYFTTNFTAIGLSGGLAQGSIVHYPVASQTRVPRNFFSDNESPDPVPNANEVGYPVSVHANITDTLEVQSFTITPRGGSALPVRLLRKADDAQTPESAAAIVPLSPLAENTVYDVRFVGRVGGVDSNGRRWSSNIDRSWSFTTQ